jgi:hypothetical protein
MCTVPFLLYLEAFHVPAQNLGRKRSMIVFVEINTDLAGG